MMRLMGMRVFAAVFVATLVVLATFVWWADEQGYLSLTGEACTDEGYSPEPTYDELRNKYGKSPYCARVYLDEAWF